MVFIYVSCMYAHMRTIACMHMCMNNSLVFVECYFYCRCIWRCILRFIRTLYAAYLIYRVVSFVVIIIYTQLSLCLCLSICYLSARTCTSVFCVYHGLFSLSYNSQKKKIKFSSLKKPLIFMQVGCIKVSVSHVLWPMQLLTIMDKILGVISINCTYQDIKKFEPPIYIAIISRL